MKLCGRCGMPGHTKRTCPAPIDFVRTHQVCTLCGTLKVLSDFHRRPSGTYRRKCKSCIYAADKKRKAKRTEEQREAQREAQRRSYNRWYEGDPEAARAHFRHYYHARRLKRKAAGKDAHEKERDWNGGIYFISEAVQGRIKIGWSRHSPGTRRRLLQTGNPDELRIIATIPGSTIFDETRLHDRFRHLRIRGEWHRPAADLLAYIAEFARPWSDLVGSEPLVEAA